MAGLVDENSKYGCDDVEFVVTTPIPSMVAFKVALWIFIVGIATNDKEIIDLTTLKIQRLHQLIRL